MSATAHCRNNRDELRPKLAIHGLQDLAICDEFNKATQVQNLQIDYFHTLIQKIISRSLKLVNWERLDAISVR